VNGLKIAVTGATGLVGSHLVDYLVKKNSFEVVAIIRNLSSAAPTVSGWSSAKVQVVETNLTDVDALRRLLKDVDVIVHAAGVVNPFGSRAQIFAVNVECTRSLLTAAKAAKVKQFIYVSSLSVITGMNDQYDVTEEAPLVTSGESYADSKVAAEQLVMAEGGGCDMAVTAVRPGFIYGARERSWLPRVIDSISSGKAALIDGGNKQTNVIYVENLNRAVEGAFLNAKSYGQVYNLTDGEVISKKQLFDAIADGLDLPRVTKVVPGRVARIFCESVSCLASVLPESMQRKLARYSRAAFRLAGLNQGFSIAKAERDLNYRDRIPFEQGMKETMSYFRKRSKANGSKSLVGSSDARR
jgi:nucleoside-diphosphate-sugar epimerase